MSASDGEKRVSDNQIGIAEQIRCVERELALRRNVYRRRVFHGTMPASAAEREIAAMEAVLATLKGVEDLRRLGPPLGALS
jgi:hypothetical protein